MGLHSSPEELDLARHTAKLVNTKGGNDLVHLALILSRLGILDLERFKREIHWWEAPNGTYSGRNRQEREYGTCTGSARQIEEYNDDVDFYNTSSTGVWIENFALPAVINDCLMQSYTGIIRLFPNMGELRQAEFNDLRAVGAFLVSAKWQEGKILSPVIIKSLAGARCHIIAPWREGLRVKEMSTSKYISFKITDKTVSFDTLPEHVYTLEERV